MAIEVSGVATSVSSVVSGAPPANGQVGNAVTPVAKGEGATATKDAAGKDTAAVKPEPGKSGHAGVPLHGFNPSIRIDSDTHMVVLTVRDPEGKVLRQIPNEHELAAYKAESTQNTKKDASSV